MPDEPRVQELLAELLDRQATPEEVCGAYPELLPVIRGRWRQICRMRAELDALLPISPLGSAPTIPAAELPLPRVPGYEVESVLGRGGMGVVYRARHVRLGRHVALKMALAGSYACPHERARFRREAEAVAALRHPNVVQVYDVGDADERPYFTMELMEGGSLARKLAGAPQPPRQTAGLLATLAAAVQAAHEAGVVHRDLKPGNVLLAADGAPKVADFGLARRLDADERLTLSGAVIGTPSYTAPEQARGDRSAVGPRTDVYALGAILYECLTGRPPFHAGTAAATLQQVVADEPVAPRRLNPSVPRDLETVCLKCLHKEPRNRYASAAELADDLGRFEHGEPIAARRVGVVGSLRKWARRRPAAAAILTAVSLVAAAGAIGAWLLLQQQADARARQALTDQEVHAILGLARVRLDDGWTAADLQKLAEARTEATRAEDVARGGASAAVRQEAESFRAETARRLARAQANRDLTEVLVDLAGPQDTREYARDESGQWRSMAGRNMDKQFAAEFRHWGLDVDGAAEAEVVARLAAEPVPVVRDLIAALDTWALWRRRNRPGADWRRLFRVADKLDRSDRGRQFRGLLLEAFSPGAEDVTGMVGAMSPWQVLSLWEFRRGVALRRLLALRRETDPRTEPVLTVSLLAQMCVETRDAASAEEVLSRASTGRPSEVLLLHQLGKLLAEQSPPRLEEAIGYYRAARSLRPSLGISLSDALVRAGRPAQAAAVMQELLGQQPDHPNYLDHLGFAQMAQGRFGDAEATYRQVVARDPDYVEAHFNLGNALREEGRLKDAERAFRNAIKLRPEFAEAHVNLGTVLSNQGRPKEAEQAFRDAIKRKPDLAVAHNNLGTVLSNQGKPKDAEQAFRDAIKLKPDLAEAHNNLGNTLSDQGRPKDAEQACRDAIKLRPDFAKAHNSLGIVLGRQGRPRDAEQACRDAIRLKPDFADAHNNLGNALTLQFRTKEAEQAFRDAISRKPDYAEAHSNLGLALGRQGKHKEAEQACRDAIRLKPDFAAAHISLSLALGRMARFDEAAVQLLELDRLLPPKDARREWARQLKSRYQQLALLDGKLAALLEGTEKPASAAERLDLRELCHVKMLYAAAARFSRDAFVAEPKLAQDVAAGARYAAACSAALAGCGQGKDAADLDDAERACWRRQALEWLRQDLAWWSKALDGSKGGQARANVRPWMQHWRSVGDFAGVRDNDALARIPAEERKAWQRFWAEVDALIRRATEPD
jgi:serine/threonine-protein kinase